MYIVHSHFSIEQPKPKMRLVAKAKPLTKKQELEVEMAYKKYKRAIKRHAENILEIRKYFPDWNPPKFDYKP